MDSIFRVFGFMGQVLGMIRQNPKLLTPVLLNIAVAVPVSIVLVIALMLVPDQYEHSIGQLMLFVGVTALYFIDYFCGGLTSSMVYDQVTSGDAKLGPAVKRTLLASPGILVFAVVSAIFDMMSHLANQRRGLMGIIGPILMSIVRAVWTTATYVMMPALVVEQQGFFAAFRRSKALMENDPTQVGVGFIGLGLVTWFLNMVFVGTAYALYQPIANFSPAAAVLFFLTMVNAFWAITGYAKGVYYTCFYLWAVECERQRSSSPQLAPAPLREVIQASAV